MMVLDDDQLLALVRSDLSHPNPNAIAHCRNCEGTGWDDDMMAACACHLWTTRNLLGPVAEDVRIDSAPRTEHPGSGKAHPTTGATEKQVAFLTKLLDERSGPRVEAIKADLAAGRMPSKATCSTVIDELLAMPKAAMPKAAKPVAPVATGGLDLSKIPTGYYAVPGGDTRLKVKVDNVVKGKWAGWVFVKDGAEYGEGQRYGSQKPGALYQGKIAAELAIIAADPWEAGKAYGQLVGRCCICNTHIEAERSVEDGIGPVCRKRFGR